MFTFILVSFIKMSVAAVLASREALRAEGLGCGRGHTHKEGELLRQEACRCVLSSANTQHQRPFPGALLTSALEKSKMEMSPTAVLTPTSLCPSPQGPCAEREA